MECQIQNKMIGWAIGVLHLMSSLKTLHGPTPDCIYQKSRLFTFKFSLWYVEMETLFLLDFSKLSGQISD